jgi:DNA topoisomerase I
MLELAAALPRFRRRARHDLDGEGTTRERVLTGALVLLDLGFCRIGSESYAADNGSDGLMTMLKRHVILGATS